MPINIYKDWKAKLESAYSFMFKYSKITVWSCFGAELDNGVQFQNQEGKGLNLNAQFTLELGLWDEKVEAL